MRKKIAGILFAMTVLVIATGLGFAEAEGAQEAAAVSRTGGASDTASSAQAETEDMISEVNFTASLEFDAATDDHVVLKITNCGNLNMRIFSQAHYMDQIGSAGSWDCSAGEEDVIAGPQQTEYIDFQIEKPVTHGDDSILAFFFQYNGHWYLGKVGENNGIEYFQQHD